MPTIAALTSFTANTQAKAAEVNANFSTIRTTVNTYCAFVDTSATITGAWTFSTAPTISGALSLGATLTITTGGIAVTGNSTITGTLTGLTGVTVTGTVTATTFSGSGASLTSIPATAISSGTLDAARLPTAIVASTSVTTPTLQGATSTPRNTVNLGDSATALLTLTSASTLSVTPTGSGNLSTFAGFNGPNGTTLNATDVRWVPLVINAVTYYFPALKF